MSDHIITGAALQFPVTMDVTENMRVMTSLLQDLPNDCLAVTPEGALSGYLPETNLVDRLDAQITADAIEEAKAIATKRNILLVFGACISTAGVWTNSSFLFDPAGGVQRYDKINLAHSEQGAFEPGNSLPVFDIEIDGAAFGLGIQMCREIRYPEQWRILAEKGAQIIAYPNNAIGSKKGDALWRAHLVSRAAETQRFVIGANNAAEDQTCPTAIVSPQGDIIAEVATGATGVAVAPMPLGDVSNWVLDQARRDVVRVDYRRIKRL